MDNIFFGESKDDEDPIPFFDLDEEIRKLIDSTSTHRDKVIEVEVKYQTKHHEISAKILALREQLESLAHEAIRRVQKAQGSIQRRHGSLECFASAKGRRGS